MHDSELTNPTSDFRLSVFEIRFHRLNWWVHRFNWWGGHDQNMQEPWCHSSCHHQLIIAVVINDHAPESSSTEPWQALTRAWGLQSGGLQSGGTRFGPGPSQALTSVEKIHRTLNCTSCLRNMPNKAIIGTYQTYFVQESICTELMGWPQPVRQQSWCQLPISDFRLSVFGKYRSMMTFNSTYRCHSTAKTESIGEARFETSTIKFQNMPSCLCLQGYTFWCCF